MADYKNVTVYRASSIQAPGQALLTGGTASGVGASGLKLEPDLVNGWKRVPRLGGDYIIEGEAQAGGKVSFYVNCSASRNRRDPAEFLIQYKI